MRRRQPFYSSLVVWAVLALPAAAEQQGVHWQQDLEAAKTAAQQTGRLVLVHFWTEQCGPCVMLDKNVFSQPGVAGAIESRFVPVKLNANENSATAQRFGITRVPTDVILTPDGQIVGKLISPPTPSAYIAEVTQAANQYTSRSGAFAAAAADAPMPSQLNAAYAKLPVNPATPPAVSAGLIAPPLLPNHSAGQAGMPSVGAPMTTSTPQVSSAANAYQSPFAASQPVAAPHSMFGAPPAPGGASATAAPTPTIEPSPVVVGNRYAQVPAAGASPYPLASPMQPSLSPTQSPAINPNVPATTVPFQATPPQASATPFPAAPAQVPVTSSPATPVMMAPRSPAPSAPAIPAVSAEATPSAAPSAQPALPPNAPPLGFEGFCTVSMRTHWKWVPGDPRWGVVHRGRTYLFVGQNEQQQFMQNPDYYAPALSGVDAVLAVEHRQIVLGRREHSIDYDNQIYLFASEATLQQFTANPERYAASVRQAMGIERGRLVR